MANGTRRRWGVSITPRPLFTPGKDPVSLVQEAGWDPGPVWTGAENFAPTGIWSPDRPARSQSLYRPSYLACYKGNIYIFIYLFLFIYLSTAFCIPFEITKKGRYNIYGLSSHYTGWSKCLCAPDDYTVIIKCIETFDHPVLVNVPDTWNLYK